MAAFGGTPVSGDGLVAGQGREMVRSFNGYKLRMREGHCQFLRLAKGNIYVGCPMHDECG